MTAKTAAAISGGERYAAYVRAALSDGRVLTKPSEIKFTRYADGAVMLASAFISHAELGGASVVRTGLASSADGEEVIGNDCSFTEGGLGVTVSCALRLDAAGLVGDKLARILTGADALCDITVRAEKRDGASEICECTLEIDENGMVIRASVPEHTRALTVVADGTDSLVTDAPERTERVEIEAACTSVYGEFWTESDLVRPVSVAADGEEIDFTYKSLPLRISSVAEKLPESFNGRLSAFGKYLAVRAENAIRVFSGDKLVTERAARGVISEWVSEDGALAYSDGERVRLCRGMTDCFSEKLKADYVVVTGTGADVAVHCLDVSGGKCVGLNAEGGQIYSRDCDELAIGLYGGNVTAVGQNKISLYSPSGAQLFTRNLYFIVRKVYRSMPNVILAEAGPESTSAKMLIGLRASYVLDDENEVTDACDRAFCVRCADGYKLRVFGESEARTVAAVNGGEPALTDALYVRGDEGTFRYRPLECATVVYSYDLHPAALTLQADRHVGGEKDIAIRINAEEY